MIQRTIRRDWVFDTRPAADPTFSTAVTGGGTVARSGDAWRLRLTDVDEAQAARVDFGGDLVLDVNRLRSITLTLSATEIPEGVSLFFGLAVANQADVNDIAQRVLFSAVGSNTLQFRVDDGVVDSGPIPTAFEVDSRRREYTIDLANGIESAVPVFLTKRGKDALQVYATLDGARSNLDRAGLGLTHYAGGFQPFVRLSKASGTAAADMFLHRIEAEYTAT